MRRYLGQLRRARAEHYGVLAALTVAAALVTVVVSLAGTGEQLELPVHRLAAAPLVVVGPQHVTVGAAHRKNPQRVPVSAEPGVPTALVARIATLPGVRSVVADVTVPVAVTSGGPALTADLHGWSSAALTPFALASGHAPQRAGDVVLDASLAQRLHARPGSRLRLAGLDEPPLTVTGTAVAAPGAPPATLFTTDGTAARLSGDPARADLLGVLAAPADVDRVRHELTASVVGAHREVLSGAARGGAEDVGALSDRSNLEGLAGGVGAPVVLVGLFVVAGTVATSVSARRRHFALLRAVGATSGQLRRQVAGELAGLGVAGGLLGFPVGWLIARIGVHGMASHGVVPAGTSAWLAWWALPVACGAGVLVAQLAGFVAARRAGRIDPALALRESHTERRWVNPLRLVLGLAALGGGAAGAVAALHAAHTPQDQLNLALGSLLGFIAGVALLGPVLVSAVELLVRLPIRWSGGVSGRLALAELSRQPRRVASAVVAVALSVGFLGTVQLINKGAVHADATQNRDRLVADQVVSAPAGVAPALVTELLGEPGVRTAVGLTSTELVLPTDGGEQAAAAAVTSGQLTDVLDLDVTHGSLAGLRSGQIALSTIGAGSAHVGDRITTYLADGTPYRATVVALYQRSMGLGDAIVPDVTGVSEHLGAGVGQVLVSGQLDSATLARVGQRFPALTVADRSTVNAHAAQLDDQSLFINEFVVSLIAMLALVTVLSTLLSGAARRREAVALLDRVGATPRQQLGAVAWQAAVVAIAGVGLGVASGAPALLAVTRAMTGSYRPYLPVGVLTVVVLGVVGVVAAAVLVPTRRTLRRLDPVAG